MSALRQNYFHVGDRVKLSEDHSCTGVVENTTSRDQLGGEWICVELDSYFGDKLTSIPESELLPILDDEKRP
jgi:hypothetical protein